MVYLTRNILPLLLALFLAASCGKKEEQGSAEGPISVTTMTVKTQDKSIIFEYIAKIESSHLVNIQSRVEGFLNTENYVEGSIVEEGQILFEMDKKPFIAQLDAAKAALQKHQAALQTAKLNLDRVKPLAELNALSQKDLDDAIGSYLTNSAAVSQAEANVETALLNLSYCTIKSPIKGISGAVLQQEGSYLSLSNSKLTTVSATTPMWVNFSLSEVQMQKYRDKISSGTLLAPKHNEYEVEVIQVNGKPFPFKGKITFLQPYYNTNTGTFLIRVTVDNPEGLLLPNQYVRVRLHGAIKPHSILVPQGAVRQSSKGSYVWVVHDGKAEIRPVDLGEWDETNWFIDSGLIAGDEVVIEGGVTLYPGAAVTAKQLSKVESR